MKKIISVFLCFSILIGACAIGISFSDLSLIKANAEEVSQGVADILDQDANAPAGFNGTKDPYGLIGTSDEKVISANNELYFSIYDQSTLTSKIGDNYKASLQNNNAKDLHLTTSYFDSVRDILSTDNIGGIYYTKCTAFDSDGDGARESVAYIGWRQSDNAIVTWYLNVKTGRRTDVTVLSYASEGLSDLYKTGGYYRYEATYQALNFFDITAGDFDGDKKETVIVSVPDRESSSSKNASPRLYELSFSPSGYTIVKSGFQSYLNPAFMTGKIRSSGDYEDLLSVQIYAGDFNGDKKSDLAVVSYTNDISGTYDDASSETLYVPYLAIGYGSGSGIAASPASAVGLRTSYPVRSEKDLAYYEIPIAPGITTGDIDGDNFDEIIVAGYYGMVENDDGDWSIDDSENNDEKLITVCYDANTGGLGYKSWQTLTSNGWTAGNATTGVYLHQDWVYQPVGVATAAVNGINSKELAFISGTIYEYSNGFKEAYTPEYFKSPDNAVGSQTVNVTFISEITSGVFDGNSYGREQFAVMLGFKQEATMNYTYIPAIIGKTNIKVGENTAYQFYCTDVSPSDKLLGGSHQQASLAAVDCDNDLIKVKYNDKAYIWSDPNVVGVLQAAPYFGELGSYDDFNDGGTTVSFSTSYESEYVDYASQSIGVGFKCEVDASAFEMEFSIGYSGAWEQGTIDTTSKAQTVSFTAGANDTVILRRTPVYYYSYDLWDAANGKWIKDGHTVQVLKEATYYTLTIDEFNTFADIYNAKMTAANSKFTPITKITSETAPYLNQEGNPYGYASGTIGTQSLLLGHNGGSSSISYEESYGTGSSYSHEDGFSFELSAIAGVELFKAGLYFEGEFVWGYERTETVTSGTETEGEVCNINNADIKEATGASDALINQYSFNWSFGTWDMDFGSAGVAPVFGYGLTNVSTPAPRVSDLSYEMENGGTDIAFSWSEPESDKTIAGYNLYMSVDGGDFKKVNTELIKGTEYTLDNEQFDRTKQLEFAVTSAVEKKLSTGDSYFSESILSNICNYNGNLIGKSAYEIALEEGFEGTLAEWLESIRGEDGRNIEKIEKTATSGLTDTYTITFSDGSTSEFYVTNGEAGASAYEVAKANGYTGTQEQWLTLIGANCASGHDYSEFSVPASCGKTGLAIKVCGKCGCSEITKVDALEHSYTDTVVAPTCHTKGYTMHKCSTCGDFYIDSETDFTEHTMTTKVVENTCYADGYTISYCKACGYTEFINETAKLSHNYKETVTEPTCTSAGFTTYVCENCGNKYIDNITSVSSHDFAETVTAPTCNTQGYTTFKCKNCDEQYISNFTPMTGHAYEDTVTDPTCIKEGYTLHICKDCGSVKKDEITPAQGHNAGNWVCEDAAAGLYVQRCQVCYTKLDEKTVVINVSTDNSEGAKVENGEAVIMEYGHQTSIKLDQADGSNVVYESSNPSVATVDENGNITAVSSGDTVITVTIPGTDAKAEVKVSVKMTWWQKVHKILDSVSFFRLLFMLLGVEV